MSRKNHNPISWVPTVYFAMGLPFVVLNMVSVLMFKGMGIGDAQIALWTSLIMMPWTLKFLWSPFLEMFKTKKFFVVLTQMVTGAGFALVALALQLPFFFAICIALLAVIAFSGATHDVATDGVYMSELNKQDQAKYIGWQGAFYNIAKIVASGGLVWLAGALLVGFGGVEGATEAVRHEATRHAWMTVMLILAAVMLLLGFYHMRMLPSGGAAASGAKSARETWEQLVAVIKDFFLKKHIWYYIAFIILYRLAEGFVMKIVPLFLKAERSAGGLGLNEQQIGLYYGTYGAAAFVLGSLLAGYYISHRGLRRTLFSLCCIFNLPFVAYTLLAMYQPESGLLIGSAIVLDNQGDVRIVIANEVLETVAPSKTTVPGLGYIKRSFTQKNVVDARKIEVEKRNPGIAWGAVYAEFESPVSDVKQQGGDLNVEKQLYVERTVNNVPQLQPITAKTVLQVGDKVVSRLSIRVDRPMDFVQLKDQRGACFEPIGSISGYRWNNGLGYYVDIKDASTNFFFDHLGKGVYVLEYSYRVSRAGTYETGLATMQCAYAPEYASHSASMTIIIK